MSLTDWIATTGVSLLLLGFFLNQRGRVGQSSPIYLGLNVVGSAVAGVAAWMGGLIPFVVLEAVWCAVAAWGLIALPRRLAAPAAQ